MKRLILGLVLALTAASLIAVPVMAASKSLQGNVNLVQKDWTDWSIIPGGAWGKYNYRLSGPDISGVFNGHGLVPGTAYTLIAYTDTDEVGWGTYTVLGTGTVNDSGDIHIANDPIDIGAPHTYSVQPDYVGETGYKIWLVSGSTITLPWPPPADWLWETSLVISPP